MSTTLSRWFGSLLLSCGILGISASLGAAQEADKPAKSPDVRLDKVVMFTSGVGYFEHQGQVDGNAQVELRFNVKDINDLLKSLILEDRGGGTISTVTYGSRDPITKTLQTFPIDLTNNPTLSAILNQVRGERIEVDAPSPTTGTLLGVESRRRKTEDKGFVDVDFLNLLTDNGLQSLPMDSIGRIKLLNPQLDKDFRQALVELATGHNNDKKAVTLDFLGSGKRPVRVGYIQETPVWKTSYRLVLDDEGKPFLQGWAIVENTSEQDWNDVRLTLVSGRPISYRMDLYEPLYVERPLEQLELFASLRPQVYGQDMLADAQAGSAVAVPQQAKAMRRMARGMGGGMTPEAPPQPAAAPALEMAGGENNPYAIQNSVARATAGDVGELFQYVIDTPVTLNRQKSAMLPIVNQNVSGEKLSIYNPQVQAKHPLNGLRLVNSTDLHLMQGPITVFDGATYAGDAKIEDLAPGADRLVSYALDLKTEVAAESKPHAEQYVSLKLVKGILEIQRKLVRQTDYTVKNSDKKSKTVLIEQPFDATWKLVAPQQPAEKTRSLYRFAVTAESNKPAKLEVVEERILEESVALSNLDDRMIVFYSKHKTASPELKAALASVLEQKQALVTVTRSREEVIARLGAISEEQARIRQNMDHLDRNSELYRRYVQKFGDQETTIEKMRAEIELLAQKENELRSALEEHLSTLTL